MKKIDELLNQIGNKKLLVVFPHPDDETVMASGLIQRALALGWQVKVVCLTRGEAGQVHVHPQGISILKLRRLEMEKAMDILGVKEVVLWHQGDGRLKDRDDWQERLGELVVEYNPGMVVSYGPDGVSGHPDHLSAGRWLFERVKSGADFELLWPAFKGEPRKYLENKVKTAERLSEPELELKMVTSEINNKRAALLAHESQNLSTVLAWLDQETAEYFAVPDLEKEYDFSYVEFDLGE